MLITRVNHTEHIKQNTGEVVSEFGGGTSKLCCMCKIIKSSEF